MSAVSDRLPVFPWDKLEPFKATAAAHPGGIVDLSVGTPVDPVPQLIQKALVAAADSPGYPTVWGTPELRDALVAWCERRLGARDFTHRNVLPVVGSKELVAWLPVQLGLGPGDKVAYPRLAYPTYEVGARLARADHVAYDDPLELDPAGLKLLWLNSPSNPTGRVLSQQELTRIVAWAREHGILVFGRRVLPGAWLGGRPGLGPAPRGVRRLVRGDRRGPLAVEAVEPRGLPGGVPGR
ncbi:aspartate/methionine/tyrosine aminotransferase [Streptomyces aurantiacus]|nr:aspartate/methionine/tyrosine aminotransferase [Streptomyces aurantiacus]